MGTKKLYWRGCVSDGSKMKGWKLRVEGINSYHVDEEAASDLSGFVAAWE